MVTIDLASPPSRPRTLSTRRLRKEQRSDAGERASGLLRILDAARPRTRAACRSGPRPCLFVSCRFHLYLDVNEASGAVKLNFPHLEPWELTDSCALDLAERGGLTYEEIGALLNVSRERARQIEEHGLGKLKAQS